MKPLCSFFAMKYTTLIILSMLFLLSGCSLLDNRKKLAEETLETQINQDSKGAIKLVRFEKTDGQAHETNGVSGYTMDFKATIEYEEDCFKTGSGFGGWPYSDFSVLTTPPQGWDKFVAGQIYQFKKGWRIAINGKAEYEKKESGWVLSQPLQLLHAEDGK